jgi:hypothetical protein
MFLDPGSLLMLALLVGVSGWVLKGLMVTWHRIHKGDDHTKRFEEMEDRLRKIEAATSSLLVDVSSIREKQRFMAKLQAGGAEQRAIAAAVERAETGISPMDTQSIPVVPRMGSR